MHSIKALVLAAGCSSRMISNKPKVLHNILDMSMIDHVLTSVIQADVEDVCVVLSSITGEQVKKHIDETIDSPISYERQEEQLGTAHAVLCARNQLDKEYTLVLFGDIPLIKSETLSSFIDLALKKKSDALVMSSVVENPDGFARVIREGFSFKRIVEEEEVNSIEKLSKEINTGVYIFNTKALLKALENITNNNSQKEYYLSDIVNIIKDSQGRIDIIKINDVEQFKGVNTRIELSECESILKKRINEYHMLNGVTIIDPNSTYISKNVIIGVDTVVYPNTIITGNSIIGKGNSIGPNTQIKNATIGNECTINNSVVMDSHLLDGIKVGPFAYIRPNCNISDNVKIGDFVEVKNSNIGEGTKASHLTYIGDSDVGEKVNFGCGTVIVNYDGKKKYRSKIGDNAFIGCNTNIVSPVNIENNAYTAAGSTITEDVPAEALAIARSRQTNKEGWVRKKK